MIKEVVQVVLWRNFSDYGGYFIGLLIFVEDIDFVVVQCYLWMLLKYFNFVKIELVIGMFFVWMGSYLGLLMDDLG